MEIILRTFFCIVLFCTAICEANPKHDHHNDDFWKDLVSQLVPIWKNRSVSSTEVYNSISPLTDIPDINIKDALTTDILTDNSSSGSVQNGYDRITNNYEDGTRLALAWLIILPILGVALCCGCGFCIAKCCCGYGDTSPGHIIVTPQQQPPPQQVFIQQPPVYTQNPQTYYPSEDHGHNAQVCMPPPYETRPQVQYPTQAWDAHFHQGGGVVHNPNYAPPPSAPQPQYNPGTF